MTKYTSGRQKNLKIGISSYSENLTSLEVIGGVGIGTTNAKAGLDVVGSGKFTGTVTASSFIGISSIQVLKNNINIGTGSTSINFTGSGISSIRDNGSGFTSITIDLQSNLDGGTPTSNYGGIEAIDGGSI